MSTTLDQVRQALEQVKAEVGPKFTCSLSEHLQAQAIDRLNKLLDYTVNGGKFARSCLVLDTFKALRPDASSAELEKAAKVSTIMEILQAFFLIIDDVMDNGEVRRGKPCWHRLPSVGLVAINDGLMLDQLADLVVRETLPDHPRMQTILYEIQATKRKTVLGELFDTTSRTLAECTFDRYEQIIAHKTTFYTYTLPIKIGFYLADRDDFDELIEPTKQLGLFFSALDDYQDVFGDPSRTGKTTTNDLVDGKCTWLTCTALRLLRQPRNQPLLQRFEANFGSAERERVAEAKRVLQELRLDQLYLDYERAQYARLKEALAQLRIREMRPVMAEALEFIVRLSRKIRNVQ